MVETPFSTVAVVLLHSYCLLMSQALLACSQVLPMGQHADFLVLVLMKHTRSSAQQSSSRSTSAPGCCSCLSVPDYRYMV